MQGTQPELWARAQAFFTASAVASYPPEGLLDDMVAAGEAESDGSGLGALQALLAQPGGLDQARSAYLDLFDRGGSRASLYETEYGRMRGMSKGNDLADISGFYHAFGLAIDAESIPEMVDHIAVELEFYGVLLLKQAALGAAGDLEGGDIVQDARRKFLSDHLSRVACAIADRPEVQQHSIYGPAFAWCWSLVGRECQDLGVPPPVLDYFAKESAEDIMECGAVCMTPQ